MEALTITATVFAIAGTLTTALLAYLVLRIRVEAHDSSERLRREVTEQLKEMRSELNANVRERFDGLEHEVNKLRERMHEVGNKLQSLMGWVEQSKSNHERIRLVEDRVRDLERSAPHRKTDVT